MFFKRDLSKILTRFAKFPVVIILGPRQSGKTTLAQKSFKKHVYLSFEDPAIREFAASDPKRFLNDNENDHGIIIDEFQYVPEILSYIQLVVDTHKRPGYFVLTGSQNFLANQAITQSLAGRAGIVTLLPLSIHELKINKILDERVNEVIVRGGYPRIYDEGIDFVNFYASYIHTYVERDVRQLVNVGDLRVFQKFLGLCAGRIGQLLNFSELAADCGITAPTAHKWISILEASYVVFVLQPHFNNFNKRLIKTPKLFFFDTGLACNLLGITTANILSTSPHRGHLFENFVINDLNKQFYNVGRQPRLYFWRDTNDRLEIDCIIDTESRLFPIEIKSSETFAPQFFHGLEQWNALSKVAPEDTYLIYGGQMKQTRALGNVRGWEDSGNLVTELYKKFE